MVVKHAHPPEKFRQGLCPHPVAMLAAARDASLCNSGADSANQQRASLRNTRYVEVGRSNGVCCHLRRKCQGFQRLNVTRRP